jgi:hypothetical protein
MSHALVALGSAALTAYVLLPPTENGSFHFGLFVLAAGFIVIAAIVASQSEDK